MKLRSWYSVFLAGDPVPSPAVLLQAIRPSIAGLVADFDRDDEDWRTGRFCLSGVMEPVILVERLERGDEGFAARLDGFDAALGELVQEPHRDLVLAHLLRTRCVADLVPTPVVELGGAVKARACEQLCGILARAAMGVIQVFQEGFFSAEGERLLPYDPGHRLKTR